MKKYNYEWALERFNETLASVKNGLATDVYEARSLPLNNVKNMKKTLSSVPKGSAIWQHTSKWHVAMIYIQKGQGQRFNRSLLDLIASGVNTPAKFKQAWLKKNGGNMGTFPTVKVSKTSEIRHAQASYIVADFNKQDVVSSGTAVEHIAVATHGLYLLWIPLITGSTDNFGVPTLVTDTVSPQALTAAVTKQAKAAGARTTADLVTDVTSAGFIFYYRSGTASGTAVK